MFTLVVSYAYQRGMLVGGLCMNAICGIEVDGVHGASVAADDE